MPDNNKKKVKDNSPIWVYGVHAVTSCLQHQPENIINAYYAKTDSVLEKIIDELSTLGIPAKQLDNKTLSNQLGSDAIHQSIAVQLKSLKTFNENDLTRIIDTKLANNENILLLILDGVTDPRNLGACLRSANGAGVDAVIAPKDNAASLTAVTRKTASGAAETTPFIQVANIQRTLKLCKEKSIWVYGTSDKANNSLYDEKFQANVALVMGSEGKGLRQLTEKNCDVLLSLPMWGTVSSLNVSVASGICLYEIRRQLKT